MKEAHVREKGSDEGYGCLLSGKQRALGFCLIDALAPTGARHRNTINETTLNAGARSHDTASRMPVMRQRHQQKPTYLRTLRVV